MTLTAVGWIVVHSLWQGALVGAGAALVLGLARRRSAGLRYGIAYAAVLLMALVPVATAVSGFNATRWKMPSASLQRVDAFVDVPSFLWWASVIVPVLGGLWLAGAAGGVVRLAREIGRTRALRRSAVRTIESPIGVPVCLSPLAGVPMVLGARRPLILLPAGVVDTLSGTQLRAILAHERAHVRRHDYFANLWQVGADILLWHHPAARWLSRVARTEREYCCDDAAVRASGDALGYARALATLEDARATPRLAVAASCGTLLDRIQRLAGVPRRTLTARRGALICLAAGAAGLAVWSLAMLVPPDLPFGVEMRRRMQSPGGTAPAASVPAGESRPRVPLR
jgi:beta-lactamase regulating signal transducer with metallopeptidase domain